MAEPTIKCELCRIDVPVSKLHPPKPYVRCADHRCPLHTPEENAELAAEHLARIQPK